MHRSVIRRFHVYFSNESLRSTDILGPKASIRFIVECENFVVTTNGGSEAILRQASSPLLDQTFNIEFLYLLLPPISQNHINGMLTYMNIPSSMEVSREVSSHAFVAALICRRRRFRCLHIIVELKVQRVIYYRTRSIDQDLEELEAILVDIQASTSQSSIHAWEFKKFDDHKKEGESSTCTICIDEFVSGVDITRLPCRHVFHNECIRKWLENNDSCPLCRFTIFS
ncbi:hypothetical protein NE237_032900 [Protea cynaroides]|uniref:RING-type domain-containing protein n=1 Tax=Protea cynaroides TaxID=273540 RepID=A0A9Q0R3I3_9MAGN|nr:hypothetical protein NE237_032900 [Protea cynaroides]